MLRGISGLCLLMSGFFLGAGSLVLKAQVCPTNIDFENGNMDGWSFYVGSPAAIGGQNVISLTSVGFPVEGRHTLFSAFPGAGLDPYGGFPINCPNGSGYSIRLGNNQAGTQAEGVSYQFTIPQDQQIYSLIYHYAVVFQDPNHEIFQQPRLELEITNVTDNKLIECSSFTFIPHGSLLPGFFLSPNQGGDTPVWCKDWTAVSINLNNHAGKTIRLFFKTADCTFRRHFGYAYIDVNTECTSEFVGAAYCPDDTVVNVTAPYGYQNYTWYDQSFSRQLGKNQTISFSPLPQPGTVYAVEVVPYHGYGCLDTLYARLVDTLTVNSRAGEDAISCNQSPVLIGSNYKPGLTYSWSPSNGLSNPRISNPMASPSQTTDYVLTTSHDGGGCVDHDTVRVVASIIRNEMNLLGKANYCSDSGDSAVLLVNPTDSIQWFRDNQVIPGANQANYRVNRSGTYHAMLFNEDGCSLGTAKQPVIIDDPTPGIRYPIQYAVLDLPLDLKARNFGVSATWSPGAWLNTTQSFTPVFNGLEDQLYTIEIKTMGGCVTVDTQLVQTVKQVEVFVPTAFTPNRDGLNDFLRPILMGIKEVRYFRIFNRWGELIFETRTDRPGWDGTINGRAQGSQVFVWVLEGLGVDNKIYRRKGTSALIR